MAVNQSMSGKCVIAVERVNMMFTVNNMFISCIPKHDLHRGSVDNVIHDSLITTRAQ